MDPNTHSTRAPDDRAPDGRQPDDGLGGLVAAVDALATQDLDQLSATAKAQRLVRWQQLLDRQHGLWLQELAALDAVGAAGADQGEQAASTAGWLRRRLRLSAGVALGHVRTARALFRGLLTETAAALTTGAISPAHAKVIADGTHRLPDHVKLDADPVLAELAGRVDPPRLPPGGRASGSGRRPRRRRPPGRSPPCAPRVVAVSDLAGDGGRRRAPGTGGGPDRAGGVGAVGPPGRRPRRPEW